jgi:FKBP-type peptidyl-prolyl cis-trans isomerase SlyD
MRAGERKRVRLPPEHAYGLPDPKAIMELAREMVPEGALVVGTQLSRRGLKGEPLPPVTVKEVKERTVVLDLNHPLAGKTLVFDVRVLRVIPAGGAARADPAPKPAQ